MSFQTFQASRRGARIAPLLDSPAILSAMEELSRRRAPAVAALDAALPDGFSLDPTERQYVGRWIKDKLAQRDWRPWRQRRFPGGRVFTSGTVYVRPPTLASDATAIPADLAPPAERLARARALISTFSTTDYGIDDFLRDKRAEAALG